MLKSVTKNIEGLSFTRSDKRCPKYAVYVLSKNYSCAEVIDN